MNIAKTLGQRQSGLICVASIGWSLGIKQAQHPVVDVGSFRVVAIIRVGNTAHVALMGFEPVISIGHGDDETNVPGLPEVNPTFSWVRLAQRIPVRIHIDRLPEGVELVAGLSASVSIAP